MTHLRAFSRPALAVPSTGLHGAPFTAADWPLLAELFADPEAARWLLRDPKSVDVQAHARKTAARFAENWASDGFGPYLLRLGPRPVGYAGLRRSRLDTAIENEALWALLPRFRGAGRAAQALRAIIDDHGTQDPSAPCIASWTLPDNTAALRVMQKLGFAYERDAVWAGLRHVVYRLPSAQASTNTLHARPRAGAA